MLKHVPIKTNVLTHTKKYIFDVASEFIMII